MAFIVEPNKGEILRINVWHWRPTMKLLYCEWVVDQETYERMSMNFCGAEVDAEKANQIADVIEKQLSKMVPGERMLDDFSLTKEPKS